MNDVPTIPTYYDMGDLVKHLVDKYPHDGELYDKVVRDLDNAFLDAIMPLYRYNQSAAAMAAGVNRGTFRKKIKAYRDMRSNNATIVRSNEKDDECGTGCTFGAGGESCGGFCTGSNALPAAGEPQPCPTPSTGSEEPS